MKSQKSNRMKLKHFYLGLTLFVSMGLLADEGMWLPQLIEAMNIKDMKKNGCKLSAEQIYSINKSSLKDAIVQFGGGCTAEIISSKGLLLTNHHCGYSSIASKSTVQNDYLTNGFWAMNQKEELSIPGLTVTFINRIEDVTTKVMNGISASLTEPKKDSLIKANIKQLEQAAVKGTRYDAFIRPFFYGNEYYLFVVEVYKDVRMVGAPPSSIGKFGGDTDNWMWPRHTGDFSLFRIYADKDNQPAEYSADNVPYTPKQSLTISLKGYEKGDFTMVYGFPGRTQEYLPSQAVDMIMNESDPLKVSLREKRLLVMAADMKKSDEVRIMYAAKYASIANYYKKWMGEMNGLKKFDALNKKKAFEADFLKTVSKNEAQKEKYTSMFSQFQKIYDDYRILNRQVDYYSECLLAVDAFSYARGYGNLYNELKKKKAGQSNTFDKSLTEYKKLGFFKNYNPPTDYTLCITMLNAYIEGVKADDRPDVLDSLISANGGDAKKVADYLFTNTALNDKAKVAELLNNLENNPAVLEKDPVYVLVSDIVKYYSVNVFPQLQYNEYELNELQKQYVQGLREVFKNKKFYPDANSTLRVSYGKVNNYIPRDGVIYNHYTTLEGIMEKENPKEDEFIVFPKLKELYQKKDYGMYADKEGKLRIAFTAANHTTGGNSGSPVLNAKGQLIGTNFDRNWEGTMSDIMYNPEMCRNIVLDVRYTLFVIDKFAGAGYLLNEMNIEK